MHCPFVVSGRDWVVGDRSQQKFAEYLLLIPSRRGSEPYSQHVLVALYWVSQVSHFLQIQEEHPSPGHGSTRELVTPFSARFLSSTHFFSGDSFFIHIHRYLQVPFTQAQQKGLSLRFSQHYPSSYSCSKLGGPLKWSDMHFYLKKRFSL